MQPASFAAVRHVLFYEWDPISVSGNVALSDEYDRYIPELLAMVNEGRDARVIAQRLGEIERELFAETPAAFKDRVAASLLALRDGHGA